MVLLKGDQPQLKRNSLIERRLLLKKKLNGFIKRRLPLSRNKHSFIDRKLPSK